ncbi:MAG: hypothetical protein HQK53_05255 [Oligoflexia bacterium]|nr:hypothetical protein [Oligoflexia bacterium]
MRNSTLLLVIFLCVCTFYIVGGTSARGNGLEATPATTTSKNQNGGPDINALPKNREDKQKESGVNVHTIGIAAGETFLLGNFGKHGDDKITFDLLYTYSASHTFDFLVDAHSSNHDFAQERVSIMGLAFGIKGKFYQFDSFSPFWLGGLGFYRPTVNRKVDGNYVESGAKTTFGYHIGAGIDLRLNSNVTVGMLGHYHDPFDINQTLGPKVSGAYFKLMLTFGYSFWF